MRPNYISLAWMCVVHARVVALIAVVLVGILLSPRLVRAFQESDAKLTAAKDAYQLGMTEAKAAYVAAYREEIAKQTEKKNVEAVSRLQDEIKIFEKDTMLFGRPELAKAIMKFGADRKKLGDTLTAAYVEAADVQMKAGKVEQADGLRRELGALGLPSKLNSIKLFGTSGYVMHGGYKGLVKPAPNLALQLNATFEIVNGLAESGHVSIRSLNCPNQYLNHGDFKIQLSHFQDNAGYLQNATFQKVKGLGKPTGVSFEAINYPKHFVRAWNGELLLEKDPVDVKKPTAKDRAFRADCTFAIVEPLSKLW